MHRSMDNVGKCNMPTGMYPSFFIFIFNFIFSLSLLLQARKCDLNTCCQHGNSPPEPPFVWTGQAFAACLPASVALARADVFCEILDKIAKFMKIFVKVDLLHSYVAPY